MSYIIVQPSQTCLMSRDAEHRGHWAPCDCREESGVLVHHTYFTCRLCGYRLAVASTEIHAIPHDRRRDS